MDTKMPEVAESGPEIRPRQPESEPGSEPVDRNVRPRLAPDQEVTLLDEVENSQSTMQTRQDVGQTLNEVLVDNPSGNASAMPISYPLVSAVAPNLRLQSCHSSSRPEKHFGLRNNLEL